MANAKLGADNTGDSGAVFKILVRLCGLAAVAGIFLPFILDKSILHWITFLKDGPSGFVGNLQNLTAGTNTMGTITNIVWISAYLLFPIFGLNMAIRGKYAGGPFTFLLLFNIAAFFLVNFFGPETNSFAGNFFVNTGPGYWISCGGLFAPFVAMFFLDKSI